MNGLTGSTAWGCARTGGGGSLVTYNVSQHQNILHSSPHFILCGGRHWRWSYFSLLPPPLHNPPCTSPSSSLSKTPLQLKHLVRAYRTFYLWKRQTPHHSRVGCCAVEEASAAVPGRDKARRPSAAARPLSRMDPTRAACLARCWARCSFSIFTLICFCILTAAAFSFYENRE